MKEVKFLSHLSRNIIIYVTLVITYDLLFNVLPSQQVFWMGLIVYFFAYAPVYFINDYTDVQDDKKCNKANLYLQITNKKLYWSIATLLTIFGIVGSYLLSPLSVTILLLLYGLNLAYTLPPIRMRNRILLRETLIFIIYFVKWLLIALYLQIAITQFPISLAILFSALGAYAVALYKRHVKRSILAEYIFGAVFTISLIYTVIVYPQLFWLLSPLIPLLTVLSLYYKDKQIPIGFYQTLYFFYVVIFYFLMK